jgi:hypothetical protein
MFWIGNWTSTFDMCQVSVCRDANAVGTKFRSKYFRLWIEYVG